MATKKNRGGSGKIIAKREVPAAEAPKRAAVVEAAERPRIPERVKEKDAGFGAVKVVAGVIIGLIVGVSILGRVVGGGDLDRGTSTQDQLCRGTQECKSGYVCQAYGNDAERCLKLCQVKDPLSCETGYKCESIAKQAGRKKMRVEAVCVPNAKAE
jgi:hypothetical protein